LNYKRIYESLIERGRNRKLFGYKEVHHIIPRCIGGSDDKSNLVELTPEEHYLAHQLLIRIYPKNEKLVYSAHRMCSNRPSNKLYGWLRKRHSVEISKLMKSISRGNGNSQFGTKWVHNKELRISKKIPKQSELEVGWEIGRIQKFCKFEDYKLKVKIKEELEVNRKKEMIEYFNSMYDLYINGNYKSVREFHTKENVKFQRTTMLKYWKKQTLISSKEER
jgi:hypothetical protein